MNNKNTYEDTSMMFYNNIVSEIIYLKSLRRYSSSVSSLLTPVVHKLFY